VKPLRLIPEDRNRARATAGALRLIDSLPHRERLDALDSLRTFTRAGDRVRIESARHRTRRALRARDADALALAVEAEAEALLACALAHDPAACAAPKDPEAIADG
jgi:hypothetical protein